MTNEITQADRELLAAEFAKQGSNHVAATILSGRAFDDFYDGPALRAIAAARRQAVPERMALSNAAEYLREYAHLVGDDHDTGVCNCDILRAMESLSSESLPSADSVIAATRAAANLGWDIPHNIAEAMLTAAQQEGAP